MKVRDCLGVCDRLADFFLVATAGMTKKDWMTGLSVYGELSNGYVIQCSIGLAKK